jgi:hypothetical protein
MSELVTSLALWCGYDLVWLLIRHLSDKGGPTRSFAAGGVAVRVLGAREPLHQRQGTHPWGG